jgi:hypothetical protein
VIGPTRQYAVALDQLARRIRCDRRIGFVVRIDHFDGPPENAAGRVDVLGGKVKPELCLPAVQLDAAGERQHRADLDRLGGIRAWGTRDRCAAGQPDQRNAFRPTNVHHRHSISEITGRLAGARAASYATKDSGKMAVARVPAAQAESRRD